MLFILFLFLQSISGHQLENEQQQNYDNRLNDYNQIDEIENQKEFIRNRRKRYRGNRNQGEGGPEYRDEQSNKPCDKPNTRLNFAGQCVCEKGYQTTDAYGLGCWKCNDRCHLNALCERDGQCKCMNGYRGDGIKTCELIPPIIKSINPTEYKEKDLTPNFRVNVTYSYQNYVSNEAFCSFGERVVKTQLTESDKISCPVPSGITGKILFRISFNNRDWSNDEVYFTIKPDSFNFENVAVYFLIFAIVFAIARAVYVQYKEWKRPGKMSTKTLKLARRRRRGLT